MLLNQCSYLCSIFTFAMLPLSIDLYMYSFISYFPFFYVYCVIYCIAYILNTPYFSISVFLIFLHAFV